MTDNRIEKIRAEIERRYNEYMAKDSELAAIRADECLGILSYIDSMQEEPTIPDIVDEHYWEMLGEEPVSEDLEEAAENYASTDEVLPNGKVMIDFQAEKAFRDGANWQKANLWKLADGDDLPEIDREVVVFTQNFPDDAGIMSVAVAHRPNPNGWDGKSVTTGKVEHYTPKTYGKGGWNIPDIVYWLDVELPKEIEL